MRFAFKLFVPALALVGLAGCDDYYGGGRIGYWSDNYYDRYDAPRYSRWGWHDGYYGRVYPGYWGNDGYYYYRQSPRAHRYHRGHPSHFRRHDDDDRNWQSRSRSRHEGWRGKGRDGRRGKRGD